MQTRWSLESAADQSGRIAIVTGANTGLGYETALALAAKGAEVILACRNRERADEAAQKISAQYPQARISVRLIDTGSLSSVRAFAEDFRRDYQRLDLLINNAGIMITPHFVTDDGFEGQLAVNYLGHFLLTGLLLPLLDATPRARVVSLYSLAARWGGIQFDDLNFERHYDANKAYSQSKMACLMFAIELNRRLLAAGSDTRALAAHPGFSQSDLSRHLSLPIRAMLSLVGWVLMQPGSAGALPTLYAALGDDLQGGEALGPAGRGEMKGPPTVLAPNADALDDAQRARLWALSEEMVGLSYPQS